jgi:hypothetical protein
MKKLILVGILIFSTYNTLAQNEEKTTNPTDKGHFIVDGSVYFSTNNSKSEQDLIETKNSSFGFGISPKAAYFIIDRLAAGIEISYGYSDNKFTNTDGTKTSNKSQSIAVGPFLRYYLSNGFFGQASLGFGTSKSNSNDSESKANRFRYELGLGYAIFLGQQVSLEPIISYRSNKTTQDQSTSETTNNGFTLGAGFTIYL